MAKIMLTPYIDQEIIDHIYSELGIKMEVEEDEIDEDIEYD